jgi:hypothetical protein
MTFSEPFDQFCLVQFQNIVLMSQGGCPPSVRVISCLVVAKRARWVYVAFA